MSLAVLGRIFAVPGRAEAGDNVQGLSAWGELLHSLNLEASWLWAAMDASSSSRVYSSTSPVSIAMEKQLVSSCRGRSFAAVLRVLDWWSVGAREKTSRISRFFRPQEESLLRGLEERWWTGLTLGYSGLWGLWPPGRSATGFTDHDIVFGGATLSIIGPGEPPKLFLAYNEFEGFSPLGWRDNIMALASMELFIKELGL